MIIGVTGRAGVGKSYLSSQLTDYQVIELDTVGHHVLRQPTIIQALVNLFGPTILRDGQIDRKTLGERVFSDPTALHQLNTLVHPHIFQSVKDRLTHQDYVIVGALIHDIGLHTLCDTMVCVQASDHDIYRHAQDANRIKSIHLNQRSDRDYLDLADYSFHNYFDTETLRSWQQQVDQWGQAHGRHIVE